MFPGAKLFEDAIFAAMRMTKWVEWGNAQRGARSAAASTASASGTRSTGERRARWRGGQARASIGGRDTADSTQIDTVVKLDSIDSSITVVTLSL